MWLRISDAARFIFDLLPSVAAVLLTLVTLADVFMSDQIEKLQREDKRIAKWAIVSVLVIIGVGAFFSEIIQKQEDRNELQSERNDAKNDRQIAAADRRVLVQQNGQLIMFGQNQATTEDIQNVDKELRAGFAGMEKGITSPPPPAPLPTVEHTTFTSRRAPSNDPKLPYGLQVIIQSDQTIPVAFVIECTGEVGNVSAFIAGHGTYLDQTIEPSPNDKNVAIVKFSFPLLAPETPLVVTILSAQDIRVKQIAKLHP